MNENSYSSLYNKTINDVEFFAEDELITIEPRCDINVLNFISGDFGPFKTQTLIDVPMWLAIRLKKSHKCKIKSPDWMAIDHLINLKNNEKESSISQLQDLPYHYMEIASLVLQHASDDMEDSDRVRSLLEDIENIRQHKIRQGLTAIGEQQAQQAIYHIKLNNASAMETQSIRPLLLSTLGEFYKLYHVNNEHADNSQYSQPTPRTPRTPSNLANHRHVAPHTAKSTETPEVNNQYKLRRHRR